MIDGMNGPCIPVRRQSETPLLDTFSSRSTSELDSYLLLDSVRMPVTATHVSDFSFTFTLASLIVSVAPRRRFL